MASLKWQTSRTVTSTVQKLPITAIQDLFSGVRIQMQFFEYLGSIPVKGKQLLIQVLQGVSASIDQSY